MTMKDFFTEENMKSMDKMIDMIEEYYGLKLPDKQEEVTS